MIARKQLNLLTFVADVAALAALSVVDLDDGVAVYVETLRSYFSLKTGVVAAPDDITSVSALGGLKGWFRGDDVSYSWDSILEFYIDETVGDDENDGTSALPGPAHTGPLKTLAELSRRTFRMSSPRPSPFILHLGAGGVSGGALSANVSVQIRGTTTQTSGGFVAIDAAVARVISPYTSQKTTSVIPWATGAMLVTSTDGGATIDQRGWKQHDIAVDQGVTTFGNTPVPATDTIAEYELPLFSAAVELFGSASLSILECAFDGTLIGGDLVTFRRCWLTDPSVAKALSVTLDNCYTEGGSFTQCKDVDVMGNTVLKNAITIDTSVVRVEGAAIDAENLGGDAGFVVGALGKLIILNGGGNLEAFQAEAPIRISESTGTADIQVSNVTWYFGAQVTYGLLIEVTNAVITYADNNNLVTAAVTAEWAHSNGAGGLTTGAFVAGLPSVAQLPTNLVGIFARA